MKKVRSVLRYFFIPGHHNNHQSALLSHGALTAYLILAVASFVIFRNIALQTNNILGFATDISVDRIVELTNAQRQSSGIGTLTYNAQLSEAAAAKASDMMSKGYWAHFGPNGEAPWGFILGAGYQYEYAGENLAKNFMDSGSVVNAWMQSESHRANILNNNYVDIGVAVVNGNLSGEDTTLVVQMFGARSTIAGESTTNSEPQQVLDEPVQTTPIPVRGRTIPTRAQEPTIGLRADNPTATPVLSEQIVIAPKTSSATSTSPYINLLPAFRLISAVAIAFLIVIFVIDLYHMSRTQFHKHRGKHVAHIIFLLAILIGIYFLGRGAIL